MCCATKKKQIYNLFASWDLLILIKISKIQPGNSEKMLKKDNIQSGDPEGVFLIFISPVQFLLHEPYFDLTPVKVIHTKSVYLNFQD